MRPTSFFLLIFSASFPTTTFGASSGCGTQVFKPKLTRIIGGREAEKHSWPWQVQLVTPMHDDGGGLCGGSLLRVTDHDEASDIVVTAGHCVTTNSSRVTLHPITYDVSKVEASFGAHSLDVLSIGEESRRPSEIRPHPDYREALHNDIALIKLEKLVNFTDNIRPICLPEKDDELPVGKTCAIVGWGRTSGQTSETSNELKQLIVPLHSASTCTKNQYGGWGADFIENEMVCAGPLEGDEGTCGGDSGGGLVCRHEDTGPFFLYGVSSFVYGTGECLHPGTPAIFANVIRYVEWIKGEMRKMSSLISHE